MEKIEKNKKSKRKQEIEDDDDSWCSDEMPDYHKRDSQMELDDDLSDTQIEFEFYDSHPNQYNCVKNLVNSLLDGQGYHSGDLADVITQQVELGTMVGVQEPDSNQLQEKQILGLATIIDLAKLKAQGRQSASQILQFIQSKLHKDNGVTHHLSQLHNKTVGLLVNERVINLSPQVVPVLFQQLQQDLQWVHQQQEYQGCHQYQYIITLSQCFKEDSKQDRGSRAQKKVNVTNHLDNYIYAKFEDYLFLQNCVAYQMYEGQAAKSQSGLSANDNQNLQKVTKLIILMTMDQFQQNIEKIPLQLE